MNNTKPSPRSSRLGSLSLKLLLSLVAILFTLGFAELALRVVGLNPPSRESGNVTHPLWHHWHESRYRFEFHTEGEGIVHTIRFNEHGMRDSRPISFARPPGTLRIAVVGDSFVEAMQVEETEGIVRQLEQQLKARLKRPVEVLNFGCSGMSTSLEFVLVRDFVLKFGPDQVILLHHFTDMTEDSSFAGEAHYQGQQLVGIGGRPGRGRGRRIRSVLRHARLFRMLENFNHQRRLRRRPRSDPAASLQINFDAIVHDPYTADDEKAWRYSLGFLRQMAALLRQQKIPFLVAQIPIGTQVEPVPKDLATHAGFQFLADGKRLEYTGYQRRVSAFCRQYQIPYLDLLPAFRAANPTGRRRFYLKKDQHWTAAGHALAAKNIAAYLHAHKILKP